MLPDATPCPPTPETAPDPKAELRAFFLAHPDLAGASPDIEASLDAWFDPLGLSLDGDDLRVTFPHRFFKPWFDAHGRERLERAVLALWGPLVRCRYGEAPNPAPFAEVTASPPPAPDALLLGFDGRDGLTPLDPATLPDFDSFLSGPKNRFTLNVLQSLVEQSDHVLLRGVSGTGKTHLLRATAAALATRRTAEGPAGYSGDRPARSARPARPVVYCLAARDFAFLLRQNPERRDSLLAALAGASALCLDDVPLLEDDPPAQEALMHILDTLRDRRRPALCTAALPQDSSARDRVGGLLPGLFSRLGMPAPLAEPDLDVRLRFAQNGFDVLGVPAGKDIPLLLARHFGHIRLLESALRRVAAFYEHTGQLPDETDLDTIIRSSGNPQAMTPEAVLTLVATRYGYTAKDLRGKKRDPSLVEARQIAMYLCRELLGESYPALGRLFGGKDHSTVMHSVKKIKESQVTNKDMHILVTELTNTCRHHRP